MVSQAGLVCTAVLLLDICPICSASRHASHQWSHLTAFEPLFYPSVPPVTLLQNNPGAATCACMVAHQGLRAIPFRWS